MGLALLFLARGTESGLKAVRRGPGLPYQDCREPRNPSPRILYNGVELGVHSCLWQLNDKGLRRSSLASQGQPKARLKCLVTTDTFSEASPLLGQQPASLMASLISASALVRLGGGGEVGGVLIWRVVQFSHYTWRVL